MGLTASQSLSDVYLSILTEDLGIQKFLKPQASRCDRTSAKYTPEDLTGWKVGKIQCLKCGILYYNRNI